jgi:2-C-methyl-D-erythritol 4-phosphate cytidylyltransferase
MFALIPAAGSGSRMGASAAKQYVPLAGRPMLWHAIRAVCMPPIESVFVVLAPDDTLFKRHDWTAFESKLEPLYCGGASRRESVYNGLLAASSVVDDDWILVHDAARPCLAAQDLARLVQECREDEVGGLLALPATDTVKRVAHGRVAATEDRNQLSLAQTPQMFRAGLLMHALRQAGAPVTDEASAIEQLGLKPKLVAGSRENLKVTWPEDLAIAESILARRR